VFGLSKDEPGPQNMAADASSHTYESIFGTDSDSDPQPNDESVMEDCDSSQSAAFLSKKPRCAQEGNQRARLSESVAQKMEAMRYYEDNPGLSYPRLIDWCFKKIGMKKKLSTSAVSLCFSEKAEKKSQKGKSNKTWKQRSTLSNWQQKAFKALISLNWSTNYLLGSVGVNLERLV
jgi:hypothetical protein